jgi:putative tricarboxylic transport membrane protein
MIKRLLFPAIFSSLVSWNINAADMEKIHFLIPGGAGGGWDMTARGTGDALLKSDLVDNVSFQNLAGGGGGKAISHLIETAQRQPDTLMVNSTPIVVRSLTGVFPQSFRDLTPVAATIADYGAIVTSVDSNYKSWQDVIDAFKANPREVKVAGGSAKGSLDHLVAAAAFKGQGFDPKTVRYIAYGDSSKATAALLSNETPLLSTGLGEVLEMSKSGQIKILAVTAPKRLQAAPDVPTLTELGNPTVFANWRGFFAAPNTPQKKIAQYNEVLEKMYQKPQWVQVRDRNGWIDNYKPNKEFNLFLEDQEKQMEALMKELGFL